jgi:hypothetical protein
MKPIAQPVSNFVVAEIIAEEKNNLMHSGDILLTFEYKLSDF